MVAIKGMDFPERCAKCQFRIFEYEEGYEYKCFITGWILEDIDTKDRYCPLIEIKERENE